ncbi:MAG: L,D-transpeptidase family protein [Chthoniobacterales bacterium]|nr:L,D-transpeptidase family protein [Chthoniobacterales bacterium]
MAELTLGAVVQSGGHRYNRGIMTLSPLPSVLLGAGLIALAVAGCTELPNDVGVRRHRSEAAQTSQASRHPVFSSWYDDPAAKGEAKIVIDLTKQQAFYYRGETLIGRTNISSGRREFETPPGKYRVIQKEAKHVSSQYGEYVARKSGAVLRRDVDVNNDPVPKGAKFVGSPMPYFLRFRGGYGMHAGFVPRFRASHGCVRMPMRMAKNFFEAAEIGTRVEVIEPPIMVER